MEKRAPTMTSGLWDDALDQLIRFDLPSGAQTTFDTLGRPDFSSRSGLAFRSDGSLVLKSASNPSVPGGVFFEVNPNNGELVSETPIGTYNGITHNTLAFDENDLAFTISRSSGTSFLQNVNLATGQATSILNIGVANISAITFVPSNAIPEPSLLAC